MIRALDYISISYILEIYKFSGLPVSAPGLPGSSPGLPGSALGLPGSAPGLPGSFHFRFRFSLLYSLCYQLKI